MNVMYKAVDIFVIANVMLYFLQKVGGGNGANHCGTMPIVFYCLFYSTPRCRAATTNYFFASSINRAVYKMKIWWTCRPQAFRAESEISKCLILCDQQTKTQISSPHCYKTKNSSKSGQTGTREYATYLLDKWLKWLIDNLIWCRLFFCLAIHWWVSEFFI